MISVVIAGGLWIVNKFHSSLAGPNLEAHKYPEVERMKSELRKLIPPKTSFADVKKRMEGKGFKCEVITVNYGSTNGVMLSNRGPATFLQCIENNPASGSANRLTLRFNFSRDYMHDYVGYIEGISPNGGGLFLMLGN